MCISIIAMDIPPPNFEIITLPWKKLRGIPLILRLSTKLRGIPLILKIIKLRGFRPVAATDAIFSNTIFFVDRRSTYDDQNYGHRSIACSHGHHFSLFAKLTVTKKIVNHASTWSCGFWSKDLAQATWKLHDSSFWPMICFIGVIILIT